MNTKNKIRATILYSSLLAFFSFVVYMLYINQDVLYTAHDRSEFLNGSTFFNSLMSRPFGLMQYIGAWLTQFFYHPALGSVLLVGVWVLIFVVGVKAFRLKRNASALMLLPIACLLTSVVDLGYWIYISSIHGYWFSQSVGFLIMLLLLWAARCTPRKWHCIWYILGFFLYPVLGWFALLFVLCLALSEKPTWGELLSLVVLGLSAFAWHALIYSNIKLETVLYGGIPRFVTSADKTDHLTTPFLVLGVVSVLIPLCRRFLDKWIVSIMCATVGIIFTLSLMYHDKRYIDEIRMMRYAELDNWSGVLKIVGETPKPTKSMVFLKNVALMNEGGLLDKSFKMCNQGYPINNVDSIHVSFLNIAAPAVCYNYGMLNDGFRLGFECAVQSGFSPFYLKNLARCAKANGEDKLAERYITMLHAHPFYRDWQPESASEKIIELHKCYSDEISGVETSDSYLVYSISDWLGADSKLASEQTLLYAMMRCDPKNFWSALRKYVMMNPDAQFPLHAQEAYILYMDKYPEEKRMMLPISEEIYNRYKSFWATLENHLNNGVSKKDIPGRMLNNFGDTYWYYFVFYRTTYKSHPIYKGVL